MADKELAELLKTQKSLTEWMEDIKHVDTNELRKEDNEKRERLRVLNEVIGLPFDKPTQFEATDLANKTPKLVSFLKERGDELCALRLIPKEVDLPKLRMRGNTVSKTYEWFLEQKIDPTKYRADFMPHPSDYSWATIFIVNKHGIQGEIIYGGHHQLTQGFYDDQPPIIFNYDFKNWHLSKSNREALTYLKELVSMIKVGDKEKQNELKDKLSSTFSNDYVNGYFESTDSSLGTWYIDYSPILGKLYSDATISAHKKEDDVVIGQTGSPGLAKGKVQIVPESDLSKPFEKGSVLVCNVTTPDYVPIMQKAAAIVTDQGGILSHAAIVARELKIPCIVGTENATKLLKTGQLVTVDATNGKVIG